MRRLGVRIDTALANILRQLGTCILLPNRSAHSVPTSERTRFGVCIGAQAASLGCTLDIDGPSGGPPELRNILCGIHVYWSFCPYGKYTFRLLTQVISRIVPLSIQNGGDYLFELGSSRAAHQGGAALPGGE